MGTIGTQDLRRVDFKTGKFDKLILQKGYELIWEKSGMCPCIDAHATPVLQCNLCKGKGFFYFDAQPITGFTQSLSSDKYAEDYSKFGDWIIGKAMLTSRACDQISLRDRITNVRSEVVYKQIFVRDIEQEEHDEMDPNDDATTKAVTRLRYPVITTTKVRSVDTVYVEGTDFRITSKGRLEWIGNSPKNKEVVSVSYSCHPVWIALDASHIIRETQVENDGVVVFEDCPTQTIVSLEFFEYGIGVSSGTEDAVVPE